MSLLISVPPFFSHVTCDAVQIHKICYVYNYVRGVGSVVKHLTADTGIASSIPSHQLKLLEGDMYLLLPDKNAYVYQCYILGTIKNLVCHVWWALKYLALIKKLTICMPRRRMGKIKLMKGKSPSASLNKSNTPGLVGIGWDPVPGFSIWHVCIPGPGFWCYRDYRYLFLASCY